MLRLQNQTTHFISLVIDYNTLLLSSIISCVHQHHIDYYQISITVFKIKDYKKSWIKIRLKVWS